MSAAFDVVVVGAGPAGIAAAVRASEAALRVALLDDNPAPGGQIWRRGGALTNSARSWLQRLRASKIDYHPDCRVVDIPSSGVLRAECHGEPREFRFARLILATGARELFLPFPGWTLPNVFGAGGLDALTRGGWPVEGRRIVVAGTGPLLLAVSAHLAQRGAKIIVICEQASQSQLVRFGRSLWTQPGKLAQGVGYRWAARAARFHTGCWITAAHGANAVESVTLQQGNRSWDVACDAVACGFHLVPSLELPRLVGCRIDDGFVAVDAWMQTSVENVLCAGEPTGIGGVDVALIEGQIAGLSAAGSSAEAQALATRRSRMAGFIKALRAASTLNPELRRLAHAETIVCRCEDVPCGNLLPHRSWRSAKLHTRCGMGPCQGRICGAAAEFLFGWSVDDPRPPLLPVTVASLMQSADTKEKT